MELFRLMGILAIDNTEANRAIDETSTKAKNSEKEVSNAFSKIGGVASTIAKGIGIAGAAIGGAFIATVESSREYRNEMGKLDTAFQTAGHSSEEAKSTYEELNGVLGDSGQAVEAASHLALLTDNEKDLQTWTDICTGVYATFGASLPIEGLTEAANETAKSGVLTGSLVDALVWAGHSEEEFQEKLDACTSEQERQDLIMNTLNGTYQEASEQYKETNQDVIEANKANDGLSSALAKLGEIGEPILTAIKEKIAEMVEVAVPKFEALIEKIKDAREWLQKNEDTIKTWVAVLIGATVAVSAFLLILNWGAIVGAASKALSTLRIAILAVNTALKANPIGIVVSLIAGLVAAIIYLWNTNENFRKFWKKAWEEIKKAASAAWEGIKKAWNKASEWFSDIWKSIKESASKLWNDVKKFFSDAWNFIKKVWSACIGFFKGIWNGIKSAFSSVGSFFSDTFSKGWNNIKRIWNGAKSFFKGIWNGITSIFSNVGSWFSNKFSNAWNSIKNVFKNWGSFFGGLWNTIKDKFSEIGTKIGNAVSKAVKSGINGIISSIESTINNLIGMINGAIKWINKIPKVDIKKLKELSFPRLAEGGVLKAGQIGLLEGTGTEAVVPLEKNTKWINNVADSMSEMFNVKRYNSDYSDVIDKLSKVVSLLEQLLNTNIYLDSDVLVGELAPAFNNRLGNFYTSNKRNNI